MKLQIKSKYTRIKTYDIYILIKTYDIYYNTFNAATSAINSIYSGFRDLKN